MGQLAAFDVPALIQRYDLARFVETGTGRGSSLLHAVGSGFAFCVSIEIDEATAIAARTMVGDAGAILHGDSVEILPKLAAGSREPTLWWLDAHFPGSYRGVPIESHADRRVTMPLEAELRAICAARDVRCDVFLLDDLRIYERGHFHHGNMGDDVSWPVTGCAFVKELLGETHTIGRDYRDEGYLVCLPLATRAAA